MTRHFLNLSDAGGDAIAAMLADAIDRKAARAGWAKGHADADAPLAGHVLAMVFEKNSTRTRVSFDIAMRQLGGSAVLLESGTSQLGRGESIADTARVLSRMADAIMLRTDDHAKVEELARHADVPVINGLTDLSHPCQIVADLLTMVERGKSLPGLQVAWLGDGNNVLNSIVEAAGLFKFTVRMGVPVGYDCDAGFRARATAAGADLRLCRNAQEAADGADVVITDTWISMGQSDGAAKLAAMEPFQVNPALMARARPDALFLHCLPAHRGEEVTDAVMDGPQSAVWQEAENRIHAQKIGAALVLRPAMSSHADAAAMHDRVFCFTLPERNARGRVVRLGPVLAEILSAHDYPAPLRILLAEALTITAPIGSLLKDAAGQVTVQAQNTGGVIELLVCDFRNGELRGYLRHDRARVDELGPTPTLDALFDSGFLALTFDLEGTGQRYQGIVPLEGPSLAAACASYFAQSEQVPTYLQVAVDARAVPCRAAGFLIQHLPEGEEGRERLHVALDHPEWEHVLALSGSLSNAELLDAALSPDDLVWRLFHEEKEIRTTPGPKLARGCRCSVEHYRDVLSRFAPEDLNEMRDEAGQIVVDCAFCSRNFQVIV